MTPPKKYKVYPTEIREYAVEWMWSNTAEALKVQEALLEKFNVDVSCRAIYTWRKLAGMAAPKLSSSRKSGNPRLSVLDREELTAMQRFNQMIGLMKPTEQRA